MKDVEFVVRISKNCLNFLKISITLSYRQKFEHAASCTNKECSTTCSKWKLFIQHLKSCPVRMSFIF